MQARTATIRPPAHLALAKLREWVRVHGGSMCEAPGVYPRGWETSAIEHGRFRVRSVGKVEFGAAWLTRFLGTTNREPLFGYPPGGLTVESIETEWPEAGSDRVSGQVSVWFIVRRAVPPGNLPKQRDIQSIFWRAPCLSRNAC